MFYNKLKMDSVAEAVKKIMNEEESGLRMAAHAAHKSGQKMFTFKGKTYPVRVQGENVSWGEAVKEENDCVTEPKAKEIAKKEVHGHEKKMHKEEKEDNPSAKLAAPYGKEDQEETPARKTIKAHGGPVAQPKMGLAKEEAEQIEERELSAGEKSEKERLVKSMKKGFKGFRQRYGERAKSVMYATATKMAKEETEQVDEKVDVKKKTVDTLAGRVKVPADTHNQHVSTKVELKSEEVEQIDELSKKTLGSYTKKATMDAADKAVTLGYRAGRREGGTEAGEKLARRVKGLQRVGDRLAKEEAVEEGWDDMMKSVQDRAKPQPSGGSGVKQGTRYGGGRQTSKPEHDDDKKKVKEDSHVVPKGKMLLEPEKNVKLKRLTTSESKRPDQDNVPFVTNESKPLSVAKDLAHKAMKRIKNEMLGKTGTSE